MYTWLILRNTQWGFLHLFLMVLSWSYHHIERLFFHWHAVSAAVALKHTKTQTVIICKYQKLHTQSSQPSHHGPLSQYLCLCKNLSCQIHTKDSAFHNMGLSAWIPFGLAIQLTLKAVNYYTDYTGTLGYPQLKRDLTTKRRSHKFCNVWSYIGYLFK